MSRIHLTLALLLLSSVSAARAAVQTYSDLESFLSATGGAGLTHEGFDQFEDGTVISSQVGGVVFSSPNSSLGGYFPIQVLAHAAAASAPNMLGGGSVPGVESPYLQILDLAFDPTITAFAFDLTAYNPNATAASVRFQFADESSTTVTLRNGTGNESTPVFFGAIADRPIVRVTLTSGTEAGVFEEFGIDELRFGATAGGEDTTPPVCSAQPIRGEGAPGVEGTATDISDIILLERSSTTAAAPGISPQQAQTGIVSVALLEGAVNVTLGVDPFETGAASVGFRVTPTLAGRDGHGTVVATDGGGNSCRVPASFRALPPGPLHDETICSDGDFLLSVSNPGGSPAGTAACSANLPNGDEPPLPPGSGPTEMTLKKDEADGGFEPNLRMLYSHSQLSGGLLTYPAFTDVTLTVDRIDTIVPDPTRVKGSAQWSPVKITCALQSDGARASYCAGLAGGPGPDADQDGYTLCGTPADCNDQRGFVHPGATEICNGLDDNCDGTVDEGNPQQGAGVSCIVAGLQGACAVGTTSCADGPLVCRQTVRPVQEIACNGVDDDCDGSLDEAYVFNGYLPPIKADGTTAFLRKRGAIPVKFALHNCAGASITGAVARIEVHFVQNGVISDDVIDVVSVGGSNSGDLFRYDPIAQQYVYNLNASSLQSNSIYLIRTVLDDGTTHDVTISIK